MSFTIDEHRDPIVIEGMEWIAIQNDAEQYAAPSNDDDYYSYTHM